MYICCTFTWPKIHKCIKYLYANAKIHLVWAGVHLHGRVYLHMCKLTFTYMQLRSHAQKYTRVQIIHACIIYTPCVKQRMWTGLRHYQDAWVSGRQHFSWYLREKCSSRQSVFQWEQTVPLFWPTYFSTHMGQNLYIHCSQPEENSWHLGWYTDDVLFINNQEFENNLGQMYPIELDNKNTTESNTSASYLELHLSIERDGQLRTSIYDIRDTSQIFPLWVAIFQLRLAMSFLSRNIYDLPRLAHRMDVLFLWRRDFQVSFSNRDT